MAILEAAIMSAQVVKNEYNFRKEVSFLCSFIFQGAACKLEVVADSEEEARKTAFSLAKKKFGARYSRVITRKELDAPGLESQRHLLWWKEHLEEVDDGNVWNWLCRNGKYISGGYHIDKLYEVYPMIPLSWLKRAKACNKAA